MTRRGMTLMELVVGLTVTGIALSAGYAAFASVVDHRTRAAEAAHAATTEYAIRATLESWLAGARVGVEPGGPQFRGLDGVHEGYADDELWFVTTAETGLDVRETVVRLYVDREEETPEAGLTAELGERRGLARRRIEIDRGVIGLNAEYLSGVLGEPRWLPSWISSTVLPDGVRLELRTGQADTLPPLLRRPLVVPLGNTR